MRQQTPSTFTSPEVSQWRRRCLPCWALTPTLPVPPGLALTPPLPANPLLCASSGFQVLWIHYLPTHINKVLSCQTRKVKA